MSGPGATDVSASDSKTPPFTTDPEELGEVVHRSASDRFCHSDAKRESHFTFHAFLPLASRT